MSTNEGDRPWRSDPALDGLFHPENPDDVQVLVHDGGPRLSGKKPELLWVRITRKEDVVYVGTVQDAPAGLKSVQKGQEIRFMVAQGAPHPFQVKEKYLAERDDWEITPCDKCGFGELFDAPSEILRELFPTPKERAQAITFSDYCPICRRGQQVVVRRGSRKPGESGSTGKKWWQFWK